MKQFEKSTIALPESNEQEQEPVFDASKSGRRVLETSARLAEISNEDAENFASFDFENDDVLDYGDTQIQKNRHDIMHAKRMESCLLNKELLRSTRDNYLEQYEDNSQSRADFLYEKSLLDEFVYQQLSGKNAEAFIESPQFKNYSKYIYSIAIGKMRNIDGHEYFPEFTTNRVLSNPNYRKLILSQLNFKRSTDQVLETVNKCGEDYKNALTSIEKRMRNHEHLDQDELDAMGDYFYSSGKYENRVAKEFACYMFNEAGKNKELSASTEICGALANYFAHSDTRDPRIKERKIFIANISDVSKSGEPYHVRVGRSTSKFTVLEQNKAKDIVLGSDEGLKRSRQKSFTDLYSFMMVTFHELTHDYQRFAASDGKKNSSAMSYILNTILRANQNDCFPVLDTDLKRKIDENGHEESGNYYRANHDSDEMEIEADEESWLQCRKFISEHERQYAEATKDAAYHKRAMKHWSQCLDNITEVQTRRSFALKINEYGDEMSYIQYDIEQLSKSIHDLPGLLKQFPQLESYFDAQGNIRMDIFTNGEIAAVDFAGLDTHTDNFGVELATYVLSNNDLSKKLVAHIQSMGDGLSAQQANLFLGNIWNVLHQNALKTRPLKEVDFNNYVDTRTLGKFTSKETLRESYLRQYLHQLYNATRLSTVLRNMHPDFAGGITRYERNYFASYFGELLRDTKLDPEYTAGVKNAYKKTKHPILTAIANTL